MALHQQFALDLAREFRQICWRTLLASISANTMVEWESYYRKHGFSHHMDNVRHGILCSSNWNAIAIYSGAKQDQPMSPDDFIPSLVGGNEVKEPTVEELMEKAAMSGGTRYEPRA
jgi:hypothetical protein